MFIKFRNVLAILIVPTKNNYKSVLKACTYITLKKIYYLRYIKGKHGEKYLKLGENFWTHGDQYFKHGENYGKHGDNYYKHGDNF